jgi:hypothetical protein
MLAARVSATRATCRAGGESVLTFVLALSRRRAAQAAVSVSRCESLLPFDERPTETRVE